MGQSDYMVSELSLHVILAHIDTAENNYENTMIILNILVEQH